MRFHNILKTPFAGLMVNKKCLIAAAGFGKTTYLVNQIWEYFHNVPAILVTFTTTNQQNICDKIRKKYGYHPSRIKVMGWYEFVFKYFILPYKTDALPELNTITISLLFDADYSRTRLTNDGRRVSKYKKDDVKGKFFSDGWRIHKDLVSEFACLCAKGNESSIARRLDESADIICFDESQDFGGPDYKIIKIIAKLYKGTVLLATDPRQHIYTTTKYGGKDSGKIDTYIQNKIWTKRNKYIEIDDTTLSKSHRCIEPICALATTLFTSMTPTEPCSCPDCEARRNEYSGLKGVFAVMEDDIQEFADTHNPLNLIYDRRESSLVVGKYMTMGDSKGTESDVVLLYPTEKMAKFLFLNRTIVLAEMTRNKLYVGTTRARYLLGIVFRNRYEFNNKLIPVWQR